MLWVYTNENGHLKRIDQEEGIDIFKKNKDNQWEIVNFIGYEKKSSCHSN